MTTTYSLDQLRADIETKYGPFVIDLGDGATATLDPMMRLPKERRAAFSEKYRALQSMQADQENLDLDGLLDPIWDLLRVVARDDGSAARLAAALPDPDPATLLELFEQYAERSQPGEASPSET